MARKRLNRPTAPLYPDHPAAEHRWRLERARRFMTDDGLDALILSRNVNVFYITGTRFVFVGMEAPLGLSPQTTAVVTPEADIYCQRFGPFDTDDVALHTTWSEQLEFYDDELELVGILQDYGLTKGDRIGIEWGPGLCSGINPLKFLELRERVADRIGAELVDATTTNCKVRAVKSELEIERMRVAAQAAARAVDRVLDIVEIGMNQLEVMRLASRFMLEEGANKVGHCQVMSRGGADGLRFGSCNALDRPIEAGYVNLDLGCKVGGYWSDINRGVFVGREPTADESFLYEVRKEANAVLDRTIKPGVPMDDVLSELKSFIESHGCEMPVNHGGLSGGHSIGLEPYQQPNMTESALQPAFRDASGQVRFEAGMMFTYEMPVRKPGSDAFFNIEDDVVVTETGVEVLSSAVSRDVRIKV